MCVIIKHLLLKSWFANIYSKPICLCDFIILSHYMWYWQGQKLKDTATTIARATKLSKFLYESFYVFTKFCNSTWLFLFPCFVKMNVLELHFLVQFQRKMKHFIDYDFSQLDEESRLWSHFEFHLIIAFLRQILFDVWKDWNPILQ